MRHIHARVTDAEHAAAMRFAAENGVTVSGLATALCRWLDSGDEMTPDVEQCVKWLVAEAERIDTEHGSRRPEGD